MAAAHYRFLFHDVEQRSRATGTFVKPDRLAAYMNLMFSAGQGLMLGLTGSGAAYRH